MTEEIQPQEWEAIGGGQSVGIYTKVDGTMPLHSAIHIASCWHYAETDMYANARLIVKAPMLLQALTKLIDAVDDTWAEHRIASLEVAAKEARKIVDRMSDD